MPAEGPSAFVRLLLEHQGALLRYILPLVGNLDDAQDVLQQTALALWQKFGQYDPSLPFLPFAATCLRRVSLAAVRVVMAAAPGAGPRGRGAAPPWRSPLCGR